MNTQIQTLSFDTIPVLFNGDAFLNATAIAKAFNKRAQHYLDSDRTKEYIEALVEHLNQKSKAVKTAFDEKQVVIVKSGAPENGGGTWLHPKLAIDFARWLNPKFAVWCDEQIEHLLKNGQMPTVQPAVPAPRPITIEDLGGLPTRKEIHSLFLLLRDIKKDVEGWGDINFENWVQKNNPRGAMSHQLTYPELVHITRTLHHELTAAYHWHPMREFMQQPALPMVIAPATPQTATASHQLINDASDALWHLSRFLKHAAVILNTVNHFMRNGDTWQVSCQIELLHDLVEHAEDFEAYELSYKLNDLVFD